MNITTIKGSEPYLLSSTITTDYGGQGDLKVNMTNSTDTRLTPWTSFLNPGTLENGTSVGDPAWPGIAVNLEFDRVTANYTMRGYFEASRTTGEDGATLVGDHMEGQFTLRFAGILDPYHSDVLANGTTTPTWLRTVGFNNDSQNIGFTGAAGRACSLAGAGRLAALVLVITQAVWFTLS
jgi:hypothetical protein